MNGRSARAPAAWTRLAFFGTVCVAAGISVAEGQTNTAAVPVFDVASIHQNKTDTTGHSHIYSAPENGHFRAINVPLSLLLRSAFSLPENRVIGIPSWAGSARFDIDAKTDESVDEQMRKLDSAEARSEQHKMLQALLEDRFSLKTHLETLELPIYSLVVGKKGPKLEASTANGTTISGSRGKLTIQGSDNTVSLLAEQLAKVVGRIVVDKTGIPGRFNIALSWAPDEVAAPAETGASSAAVDAGPSIFTALEEQLGLKLVAEKGPVEVLVVDHVEMPSEN